MRRVQAAGPSPLGQHEMRLKSWGSEMGYTQAGGNSLCAQTKGKSEALGGRDPKENRSGDTGCGRKGEPLARGRGRGRGGACVQG